MRAAILACGIIFGAIFFGAFFSACDGERFVEIGKKAPEIVALDMDGNSVELGDFKDRAVVLAFYKNGCAICTGTLPLLDSLAQSANLAVLAINAVDSKNEIAAFLNENPLPNTRVLRDSIHTTSGRFMVRMTPTLVLLDKNHIVRDRIIGDIDKNALKSRVESLL